MFHRPLLPLLLLLTGGILVGHKVLHSSPSFLIPSAFTITLCLLALLLASPRFRPALLFVGFFLAGILLDLNRDAPSTLLGPAQRGERVTVEGTVVEPMKLLDEGARFRVRAQWILTGSKAIPVKDHLLVTVYDHSPFLRVGEKIRFPARLKTFRNFNNPGRFDFEEAMKLRGFTCGASVSDGRSIVPMGPGELGLVKALMERVQRPVRAFFQNNLTPEKAALFRALILGERQGITWDLREPFNRTGLGHVLAVSGLHIGLVAWVSFFLFKWILSRFYTLTLKTDIIKWAALLTCVPVFCYAFMAGFQVSCQRAMIMVFAFLWSLILGREKEVWSTLALAGLIILAIDPRSLFTISFQFSFAAVIGILWLTPPLLKALSFSPASADRGLRLLKAFSSYFVGLVVVSFGAVIMLLPLIAYTFHRISCVTLLANITVVPVLGLWVIPSGLMSALFLPLFPQGAAFFLHLASWGLQGVMEMVHFWSSPDWSSFWVIRPNLIEISMYYGLVFCLFFVRRWSWVKMALVMVVMAVAVDVAYWSWRNQFNGDLRVTFLDVGQGNAALVEFPGGKRMLIDGGGFGRDQFDVGRMVVAPYLWYSKIWKVHYLVMSHPQADHMNGLRFIARTFGPQEFWYNGDRVDKVPFKELMAITASRGISKRLPSYLKMGREMNGVEVKALHPLPGGSGKGPYKVRGLNDNSLVLKITYRGRSFLFTGDLEAPGEGILVKNQRESLRSDVLLSPHHGSQSSSTKAFLKLVSPSICVISAGKGNRFGFPHAQTLERLESLNCRVIRTDQAGAIQCRVGANRFEVSTFLKPES